MVELEDCIIKIAISHSIKVLHVHVHMEYKCCKSRFFVKFNNLRVTWFHWRNSDSGTYAVRSLFMDVVAMCE